MLLACAILFGALLLWGLWLSLERRDRWSIGIYEGEDPLALHPPPLTPGQPALTAMHVTDVAAEFVADPFLIRHDSRWYLFFEVLDTATKRGVISVATSEDGRQWHYERVVLREPFHLSYPYVFECEGRHYLVPESAEADEVRLYEAVEFPWRWEYRGALISGRYYDASLLREGDRWWLFALDGSNSLTLHHAERLAGPWTPHPQSPIVRGDIRISRPAGRLTPLEGSIIRFAQDGYPAYGTSVRAFRIMQLTPSHYREREVAGGPVLAGTGRGWNASGMHHVDAQRLESGRWLAAVDGNHARRVFNWRYGAWRALKGIM